VQTLQCNPEWPICLYDFTFKLTYAHTHIYREPDGLLNRLIDNHVPDVALTEEEGFA